ncbi:MAG: hypothetical protein JW806_01170 [Sedimentisphaerales bacterium]|nr:hypothetical protein [Sedimentisphaerales bacterium]
MNKNIKTRKLCAELLQKVLAGEITPQDAIQKWPTCESEDRDLEVALHQLYHYRDDDDIRAKDLRYKKLQTEEIRKHIEILRTKT